MRSVATVLCFLYEWSSCFKYTVFLTILISLVSFALLNSLFTALYAVNMVVFSMQAIFDDLRICSGVSMFWTSNDPS